jgi:phosphonate transport system ATP-binding protein
MTDLAALTAQDVSRHFGQRAALQRLSLQVQPGEMVALLGASGSGKSTLLRLMAGMLPADAKSGAIHIHGQLLQQHGQLAPHIRHLRREIGFVFQQFNLVGRLPLIINVLAGALGRIPLYRSLFGLFTRAEWALARQALQRVGLLDYQWQRADSLSGGQQQRAAIARALVQQAKVILADEPVASLDPQSASMVMELLQDLNRTEGLTVVVSLHQVELAQRYCPRIIALRQGQIIYDGLAGTLSAFDIRKFYDTPDQSPPMEHAA